MHNGVYFLASITGCRGKIHANFIFKGGMGHGFHNDS
jgi:hypothetical protein